MYQDYYSKFLPMLNADSGADGGASQSGSQEHADVGGNNGNQTTDEAQGASSKESKPFASFPDEQSFMSRINREAKKQVNEFLKSIGVEKEDELKEIVQKNREQAEQSKTELQKAKEAAEAAIKDKENFFKKFNDTLKQNEAKVRAMALGIKPERLEYVLKLIDFKEIEIKDGAVDGGAIEEALNQVLKELPELKQQNQAGLQKGGQDFSQSTANPEFLTIEAIKAMSVEEAERRLPEIMKFMNRK